MRLSATRSVSGKGAIPGALHKISGARSSKVASVAHTAVAAFSRRAGSSCSRRAYRAAACIFPVHQAVIPGTLPRVVAGIGLIVRFFRDSRSRDVGDHTPESWCPQFDLLRTFDQVLQGLRDLDKPLTTPSATAFSNRLALLVRTSATVARAAVSMAQSFQCRCTRRRARVAGWEHASPRARRSRGSGTDHASMAECWRRYSRR